MTATTCRPCPLAFHRLQGVRPLRLRNYFMIAPVLAASAMLKECHLLSKYHNILILNLSVGHMYHFFPHFQPVQAIYKL